MSANITYISHLLPNIVFHAHDIRSILSLVNIWFVSRKFRYQSVRISVNYKHFIVIDLQNRPLGFLGILLFEGGILLRRAWIGLHQIIDLVRCCPYVQLKHWNPNVLPAMKDEPTAQRLECNFCSVRYAPYQVFRLWIVLCCMAVSATNYTGFVVRFLKNLLVFPSKIVTNVTLCERDVFVTAQAGDRLSFAWSSARNRSLLWRSNLLQGLQPQTTSQTTQRWAFFRDALRVALCEIFAGFSQHAHNPAPCQSSVLGGNFENTQTEPR